MTAKRVDLINVTLPREKKVQLGETNVSRHQFLKQGQNRDRTF